MDLAKEQIKKAMECKTADELIALAKSWGIELSHDEAEEYVAKRKSMQLTEEDLEHVAGGSCPPFSPSCKYWNPHCQGQEYPDSPCPEVCPEVWLR